MREILFRGKMNECIDRKWIKKGDWIYGFLGFADEERQRGEIYVPECYELYKDSEGDVSVDLNTIGQYTGLKDKNGKYIFEGDVLRYAPDHRNCINFDVVVADEWDCCGEVFGFSTKGGWINLRNHEDCEVISNIYDNPEYDDYEIMRTKNEEYN